MSCNPDPDRFPLIDNPASPFYKNQLLQELQNAGVSKLDTQQHKNYNFQRAWGYWIVTGETDKKIAQIIYNDPIGKLFIRTNGWCTNMDPNNVDKVNCYHIDTKVALKRFIEIINSY